MSNDPHAKNKRLYEMDRKQSSTPWDRWELRCIGWHSCGENSGWVSCANDGEHLSFREGFEYRRKAGARPLPSDEPTGELSGAELHRAIADAMDSGSFGQDFEFEDSFGNRKLLQSHQDWSDVYGLMAAGYSVRRKPRTRTITANGVDYTFPEPMREAPESGTIYYVAFDRDGLGCPGRCWIDGPWCHSWFSQSRCHATSEARDAHERALIAANGGEVPE